MGHHGRGRALSRIAAVLMAATWGAVPAQAEAYRVGIADTLRLRVMEWQPIDGLVRDWPAMTGDYAVGADGAIQVPFLGRIGVADQTTDEIGTAIATGLKQRFALPEAPDAVVEVATYRPVFVTGLVRDPGEYDFRPGLTVAQALGMAGGPSDESGRNPYSMGSYLTVKGQLDLLLDERQRLLIRQARLRAERGGAVEFALPANLTPGPRTAEISGDELAIMRIRRERIDRELGIIASRDQLLNTQITALEQKTVLLQQQQLNAQKSVESARSLVERGLAAQDRLFTAETRASTLETQLLDLSTAILQARQSLVTLERDRLALVADDLLAFDDARRAPARAIVGGHWGDAPSEVPVARYIESNGLYGRMPVLGYLKPLMRADLFAGGLRYNEDLRIAEDFDLVARAMAAGARLVITPDLTYFYRRRGSSISHRLAPAAVEAMRAADRRFRADFPGLPAPVIAALDRRLRSLDRALGYERMIDRLKARDLPGLLTEVRRAPAALPLLHQPVTARLRRILGRSLTQPPAPPADGRNIAFVSRQRIVGPTNGSSAYALGLVEDLRRKGFRPHYLCPSPVVFGSWPVLRLGPELAVFDTISIRGGWRRGDRVLATDPRIWLRAAGRVAEMAAMKARLLKRPWLGPAPYAIAAPLRDADRLFLASRLPAQADLVFCDYVFLTAAIPYALRPDAGSMVLMHDLFSAREAQFAALGGADSVASLDQKTEMAWLGRADRVIAIQAQEGAHVAQHLGADRVIVAPMAMAAVPAPQPGEGRGRVLFVGSKAAPNVDAMAWFLAEVWPRIHAARPDALFDIVGAVGATLPAPVPAGAVAHGQVADLDAFYTAADVVVSPLRAGSGLKIKLVEALARGKPIVATPVTCQGVETEVAGAVIVTEEAGPMAEAVLALLGDTPARHDLAGRALAAAERHFGAEGCYGGVTAFVRQRLDRTAPGS